MKSRASVLTVIGGVFLWVLSCYHQSIGEIAAIWWRSESYAHGLLVGPIFAWLVWRDRARFTGMQPQPSLRMALPVFLAGVAWMLGELGNVASVSHSSAVMVLVLSLFGVLGRELGWKLAFPILFLLFGIPTGEFLLPIMMKYTAMFTVSALRATGVPVYQEGLHFVLPNGRWSVIEACSGFRYLIASVMVGTLYAYLSFRTLRRRVVFSLVAVVVPVVANWLRAYMIVMIGYLSNNELATGVDHVIYGWVFFGLVVLLMFWMGAHWREDLGEDNALPDDVALPGFVWGRFLRAAAPLVIAAALAPSLLVLLFPEQPESVVPSFVAPLAVAPWNKVDTAQRPEFSPRFQGYQSQSLDHYRSGARQVSLYVAVYGNQAPGRELVQSGNVLLRVENDRWAKPDEGRGPTLPRGSLLRSVLSGEGSRAVVWSGYWIDGRLVTSDYAAKALLTLARLRGRPDRSAYVALWAQAVDEKTSDETIIAFFTDMGPALLDQLDRLQEVQ